MTRINIILFIILIIALYTHAKVRKQFVYSPQEPQAKSVDSLAPEQIKMQKPKSLKAMVDYGLCKQECKRKRDQESTGQYVQWLREELRFAEEQLRAQESQQQSVGGNNI
ncbi:hypothetical protein ACQ4LE_007679 [Meloidogyne hapla]|uniref:Uncharacterized protein n=1 Tax=Meloidogyne hapla TaxID=6305 RepID=A0A1I8BT19_MELHA